jgi:hypothetical protein
MSEREDIPEMPPTSNPRLPRPKRGDIVRYRNRLYFYQYNGTSSYLYNHPHDIGIRARVAGTASTGQIKAVDLRSAEVQAFLAALPAVSPLASPRVHFEPEVHPDFRPGGRWLPALSLSDDESTLSFND